MSTIALPSGEPVDATPIDDLPTELQYIPISVRISGEPVVTEPTSVAIAATLSGTTSALSTNCVFSYYTLTDITNSTNGGRIAELTPLTSAQTATIIQSPSTVPWTGSSAAAALQFTDPTAFNTSALVVIATDGTSPADAQVIGIQVIPIVTTSSESLVTDDANLGRPPMELQYIPISIQVTGETTVTDPTTQPVAITPSNPSPAPLRLSTEVYETGYYTLDDVYTGTDNKLYITLDPLTESASVTINQYPPVIPVSASSAAAILSFTDPTAIGQTLLFYVAMSEGVGQATYLGVVVIPVVPATAP